jgi:tRNA nucleotidyltransferase (CCA-adding enzyme)
MLFHDLGKPSTFSVDSAGTGHFYQHNKRSEEIAALHLNDLRFDNETIHTVTKLVRWHDAQIAPEHLPRWLSKLGEDHLRRLFAINRADALAQNPRSGAAKLREIDDLEHDLNQLLANTPCYKLKDLAINGYDIQNLGVKQGPEVGRILHLLLEKVMDGELENERDTLLTFCKTPSSERR